MNKIISIEDNFGLINNYNFTKYGGYKISTESDTYLILIETGTTCCEQHGYISTNEEDLSYFVGAELIDFKLTNTALNTRKLSNEGLMWNGRLDLDCGGIQFVDIETSKGVLQLAVYNSHNGWYGHDILIKKNDEVLLENYL